VSTSAMKAMLVSRTRIRRVVAQLVTAWVSASKTRCVMGSRASLAKMRIRCVMTILEMIVTRRRAERTVLDCVLRLIGVSGGR
jgi:hypothetical protein